jgi:Domain of unknown function (DUF4396)
MRQLGAAAGIRAALKSDALSVIAYEIGLFAWMALMFFVFFPGPHLKADNAAYWFSHAGRHDLRLCDRLPGERVAHPARDRGADVTSAVALAWPIGKRCR